MDSKWRCGSCSHTNWRTAPHCVSCYKPRNDELTGNGKSLQNPRFCEDNMLESLIIQQTSPSRGRRGKVKVPPGDFGNCVTGKSGYGFSGSGREVGAGRWTCLECNSENVNNSRACNQCKSAKPKKPPSAAFAPGAAPSSDNSSCGDSWAQARPKRKVKRSQGREKRSGAAGHATASLVTAPEASNLKWACSSCTFDNWPRTKRCAMCGTPRNSLAGSIGGGSSDSHSQSSSGGEGDSPIETVPYPDIQPLDRNTTADSASSSSSSRIQPQAAPAASPSPSSSSLICQSGSLSIDEDVSSRSRHHAASPAVQSNSQQRNRASQRNSSLFLSACAAVAAGDTDTLYRYLRESGDRARVLTSDEAVILNKRQHQNQLNSSGTMRPFVRGESLVHLALAYDQSDMLSVLLIGADEGRGRKRLPSYAMKAVADEVRHQVVRCIQQLKGSWPCFFVTYDALFGLPEEISTFSLPVRERLFQDVVDSEVQKELEDPERPVINWCSVITEKLGTRLYPLWNRTLGDCLLDSVLQATWGVQDRAASLRIALAESLNDGKARFYERWRESENLQAHSLHYTLDEVQWRSDFAQLQHRAAKAGASLEQLHIFALAHILRRPIVVYGIKYVKSFRGDNLGLARFQGVYLPLLWEPEVCWSSPVCLAYTRGHFSALVPVENGMTPLTPTELMVDPSCQPRSSRGRPSMLGDSSLAQHAASSADGYVAWMPLVDAQNQLLPVHFLTMDELGLEEELLHRWLDCYSFNGCRLAARQVMPRQHHLVESLMDTWLSHYRRIEARVESPADAAIALAAALDGSP